MRERKNGNFHEIFGVELRRVTSIIGRLKRWGLDSWQASCAVDFMMRELAIPLQRGWMTIDQLKETNLDKTREAAMDESRRRMKGARDLGRQVHAAIHTHYKAGQDKRILKNIAAADPELMPGIEAFLEWERLFHVDMIDTEKTVFSFVHNYAGTADLEAGVVLPAEDFGEDAPVRRVIADFKTGSPDSTMAMQLAAYVVANEEMARVEMDAGIIVYLNPDTGVPKWKIYTRPELEAPFIMFRTIKEFVELEEAWKKKEPNGGSSAEPLPPLNPSTAAPPADTNAAGDSPNFE